MTSRSEVPADLRKFVQDAMYEAVKDAPLVMTSERFMEAMIAMYIRGVADGRRGVATFDTFTRS